MVARNCHAAATANSWSDTNNPQHPLTERCQFNIDKMKDKKRPVVGITHGDINGVGYEVILKAFSDPAMLELCTPVIYGSSKIAAFYRKTLGIGGPAFNVIASAAEVATGQLNMVNVVSDDMKVEPGVSSECAGAAAFAALEQGVADLRSGAVDALVTAPINKNNIQSDTFTFPGHTEYLEASLGDGEDKALMVMVNDVMRVALVTAHVPVDKVAGALSVDGIVDKLVIFNDSLVRDFSLNNPRIAVLALNPHASDGGVIGSEEAEVIVPAIEEAAKRRINCFGPYAADGFFGSGAYRKFDGILAMTHDQGLIPFKALDSEGGVNFTAGLQYVRTSPDHGTAYDIAGKGVADEASMRHAIFRAIDIMRSRLRHADMTARPLRKQYFEKNTKDNVVLDLTKDDPQD